MAFHALEIAAQAVSGGVPSSVRLALRHSMGPAWTRLPPLRLDRLIETQGTSWADLGIRWKGVLFAHRPWVWGPYLAVLHGKSALRGISGVLR